MNVLDSYDDIMSFRVCQQLELLGETPETIQDLLQSEYSLRDQITDASAEAFALEAKTKLAFDRTATDIEKYHGLARRIIRTGSDDDARMLIRKILELKEILPEKEASYLAAKEDADLLRELGTKVHRDIKALQQKKAAILNAGERQILIPAVAETASMDVLKEDPVERELRRLKMETLVFQT